MHSHSASKWVIATPSSISLKPGQGQKIRLLIRRPKGLENGEYRAHLLVSQQPPADIAGGLQETKEEEGLQINIVTVYSTSIPVIIKHGTVNASASLVKAERINNGKDIAITVNRKGNASFRGFITVKSAESTPQYLPLTIYPEREQITRTFPLDSPLAETSRPLTMSLYAGIIPPEGTEPKTTPLTTVTVSR
jgi:P pilus assembly chaperone PapD